MQTTAEIDAASSSSSSSSSRLDALVNFGISYDSSISEVLLRQPSIQSQSSQQHLRQHRQVGVSSSNTSSSLLLDFSNVQGYAVFGDDDDDDDDGDGGEEEEDEDVYGREEDDDAENAYNDEYDE